MQSSAPDDRRKHRPKHVELTWNNKLTYIVHLVGYFHSCITMHGFMNVKGIFKLLCNLRSNFVTIRVDINMPPKTSISDSFVVATWF